MWERGIHSTKYETGLKTIKKIMSGDLSFRRAKFLKSGKERKLSFQLSIRNKEYVFTSTALATSVYSPCIL